jgi:hypothetical protein
MHTDYTRLLLLLLMLLLLVLLFDQLKGQNGALQIRGLDHQRRMSEIQTTRLKYTFLIRPFKTDKRQTAST